MCCKGEGHRTLRHREDLRVKAYWKAPKRLSLPQGKKMGKRVLRNAGVKTGVNGFLMNGKKEIATFLESRENSSQCCSPSHSETGRMDANFCVTTPVKNCSTVFVKEENLAVESRMESLPLNILVQIVCNVHHDELEPLFYVSSKFREAASIAREMHFDYTTPVRVRASRKRAISLIPDEISQNYPSFEGSDCFFSSSRMPVTPNAPKQVGTPGKESEKEFVNKNRFLRSGAAPNRVLFVEDDLCEAVEDELCL
ncbi:hypothetical protein SUGI_0720600 [Cryptomeria japonica]|nr:hypothetical protein SUGI_0720600 [Cryptomeria japonica]